VVDPVEEFLQVKVHHNAVTGRGQLPTFCIPFSFCDDRLPLAPVVRAKVAGITVSSRQGIDMHLHKRAA
jgi:hypothetical protein